MFAHAREGIFTLQVHLLLFDIVEWQRLEIFRFTRSIAGRRRGVVVDQRLQRDGHAIDWSRMAVVVIRTTLLFHCRFVCWTCRRANLRTIQIPVEILFADTILDDFHFHVGMTELNVHHNRRFRRRFMTAVGARVRREIRMAIDVILHERRRRCFVIAMLALKTKRPLTSRHGTCWLRLHGRRRRRWRYVERTFHSS